MTKVPCAIIGSGNIGTDLMIKLMRNSKHLEMAAMIGIDAVLDGLTRAQRLGIATTHEGIEGARNLPGYDGIRIFFDATSAGAHHRHDALLRQDGKQLIDLTGPAPVSFRSSESDALVKGGRI